MIAASGKMCLATACARLTTVVPEGFACHMDWILEYILHIDGAIDGAQMVPQVANLWRGVKNDLQQHIP